MTDVAGATLIRRYYEEIANQSDVEVAAAAADEILAADFVFHAPNDVVGKAGVERHKAWLRWHHGVAPEQHFTVEDMIVASGRGAARWMMRSTHRGEFLGLPGNGQQVVVSGLDYFRLSDDRIAELWRAFDLREVVRQLSSASG